MKLSQAQEMIKMQISESCKKKIEKVAKYMGKITKKDNAYVQMRDVIVIATQILVAAQENIDSVHTSKNGRETLSLMMSTVFEQEAEKGEV